MLQTDPYRKPGLEASGNVEHGCGRTRFACEPRRDRANPGLDRAAVGQLDDSPIPGSETLRIGRPNRSLDLHFRRIGDAEPLGFRLEECAKTSLFGSYPSANRAGHTPHPAPDP